MMMGMFGRRESAWVAFGAAVYFGLFGVTGGFLLLVYAASFLTGGLAVCLYYGKKKSDKIYWQAKLPLPPPSTGLQKALDLMEEDQRHIYRLDKRLTGSTNIDEQLQEIVGFIFRDFVDNWYKKISDDQRFPLEMRKTLNASIVSFASRAKEVNWIPYFTQTLVDDVASHIKLYRRAEQKVKSSANPEDTEQNLNDDIENAFFDLELEMEENMCRKMVSTDEETEKAYLRELAEALLYFLLPDADFNNRLFRFLIREVLVNKVIAPTIDLISEPDYVNQNIIWMCHDNSLSSESFLATLKMSDSEEEMDSVLKKVREEAARSRAKDTGGVDDAVIKQTLSSLSYVEKICATQICRIHVKSRGDEVDGDLLASSQQEYGFAFVLNSDLGIQYFNDYLITTEREVYLNILLDIEYFIKVAGSKLPASSTEEQLAAQMVHEIYDKYLSEETPLAVAGSSIEPVKRVRVGSEEVTSAVFDPLKQEILDYLEKTFEEFKDHPLYQKLVREVEAEKESVSSLTDEADDSGSIGSGDEALAASVEPFILSAVISKTGSYVDTKSFKGIVKDKDKGGKSYAVYNISVNQTTSSDSSDWETMRRYSDFYELYMTLSEKFPMLADLAFPGKRTFNNMDKEFLDKRGKSLNTYLQIVLSHEAFRQSAVLREVMLAFLLSGPWDKSRKILSRKVETLVNPLRTSMRNVGQKVRSVPDALFGDVLDGFGKMFTKLSFAPTLGKNTLENFKVGATLDVEDEDNIPLRIMLLLMDEVFDLRKKNQWLRRRIVAIMRQLIKATLGDKINRRIVDHVESMTSSDQVAEYIRQFKEKFWPAGVPAEKSPPRDRDTQLRTGVVCKAKMIGSVPGIDNSDVSSPLLDQGTFGFCQTSSILGFFIDPCCDKSKPENPAAATILTNTLKLALRYLIPLLALYELRHLIGTETTRAGVHRIFEMYQHKTLNKRLVYVVLEGVIQTLFPQNTFKKVFRQIHSKAQRSRTDSSFSQSSLDI